MAQAGPAGPRLCCCPACVGRPGGPAWASRRGWDGLLQGAGQECGRGLWAAMVGIGCFGPERPSSTVKHSGMEGLLLGMSFLQLSLALATRASLIPALHMEQRCRAVWADTCQFVEGRSTHSSAHPWETGLPAHQALRGRWPELTCCSFSSFSRSPESLAPVGRTQGDCCCHSTAAICPADNNVTALPTALCWLKVVSNAGDLRRAGQGRAGHSNPASDCLHPSARCQAVSEPHPG